MPITRDEILASGLPLDDHGAIATFLSSGRTKVVSTEIGKGRVLSVLGLEAGNELLDIIDNTPLFRHVKFLVANGWLDVGDSLTRQMIDQICSPENAAKLKALAVVDDPVTSQEVSKALEGM